MSECVGCLGLAEASGGCAVKLSSVVVSGICSLSLRELPVTLGKNCLWRALLSAVCVYFVLVVSGCVYVRLLLLLLCVCVCVDWKLVYVI